MIRASELYGRVLVDLDSAEKVGNVDEIIIDIFGPCIAGYVVSTSHGLLARGQRRWDDHRLYLMTSTSTKSSCGG